MATGRNSRYGNIKRGKRLDLGDTFFHSGWEADIARLFNLLVNWGVLEGYEYEPETFLFTGNGYKRGPWSYLPDFCIRFRHDANRQVLLLLRDIGFEHLEPGVLIFVEVKGQEKGSDRSKWKRFRAHVGYPLEIIKRDKMKLLEATFKPWIPEWESHIR
jgi:hypothetical protein